MLTRVVKLMMDFARITGLDPVTTCPKRYLWTDAFAVCNYLELHQQTKESQYLNLARRLVDQVHGELGKHRKDDPNGRHGWISGFNEEEGRLHPTIAGLRIGKKFNERQRHERADPELEWEQDGQYFHYLTKWMHALERMHKVTGEVQFLLWAMEMAKGVFPKFSYQTGHQLGLSSGATVKHRMYWKMSIDLSYPLVSSMGQHDALDGFITYQELELAALVAIPSGDFPANLHLHSERAVLNDMAHDGTWSTRDTLGLGGLLCDAYKVLQFSITANRKKIEVDREGETGTAVSCMAEDVLVRDLLTAALPGLRHALEEKPNFLQHPTKYRLAFRELGLAIGLRAVMDMQIWMQDHPEEYDTIQYRESLRLMQKIAEKYGPIAKIVEDFWWNIAHKATDSEASPSEVTWTDHLEINMVMLATSMYPKSFLMV
jgi:hypothetical protein